MNAKRRLASGLFIVLLSAASIACGPSGPVGPEIQSSSGQAAYAEIFSSKLEGEVKSFGDNETQVGNTANKFADYPDQLSDKAPFDKAADAVEKAAEAGRSHYYVEGVEEVGGARAFFDEEGEEITKKVGGAANYTAKQANCTAELYGPVKSTMDKTVDERLLARQRVYNEGHTIVERHREKLGEEDAKKLEEQLDEIAFASYLAHVELVEQQLRMQRMVDEAGDVKSTMEQFVTDETEYQKEAGRTDDEIAASKQRIEKMKESEAKLDAAKKKAEGMLPKLEERIPKIQDKYDEAVEKLVERYRKKASKS